MHRLVPILAFALAVSAGCKKEPAPTAGSGEASLALATFEPPSIDPAKIQDSEGARIAVDLFEGLTARAADGKPVPGMATSWSVSTDGLEWTFELRAGLVWSDDTPLDAQGFVWSMRRAVDPKTANPVVSMLWGVKNAKPISEGDLPDLTKLGVRADGSRVILSLEHPYPELPRLVALAYFLPVPRHVVEKHGDRWTRPANIVSNGAFVLEAHDHGESMTLARNPSFHAAATVGLEKVRVKFTNDGKVAANWYELGEIDWSIGLVPAEAVKRMLQEDSPHLRIEPFAGVFSLYANAEKAPFTDVRVRRALDLAIDRGKLARQVLTAGQKPATTTMPLSLTSARPPDRTRYDVTAARALLAQAGFGADKPFPVVELIYNTSEKGRRIATFIQRNLLESLGIRVEVRNIDWKAYLQRIGSPDYELALLAMGAFDALDSLGLFLAESPDNRARWRNAGYDALVGRARHAKTLEERDALITEILALTDREVPMIPLYTMTRTALLRPDIWGYEPTWDNLHPLRWMRRGAAP